MSYYVHKVPGRVRVRIPQLRNHPQRTQRVCRLLESQDGIETISANALTGSVVVRFDTDRLDDAQILDLLSENGLFDHQLAIPADEHIDRAATRAGQAMGRVLASWVLGKALESNGLSLLAALI